MNKVIALCLLMPLVACGDRSGPDVDFGGEDLGPDRHAITSHDGGVKMGLTDRYIYFALADSVLQGVRSELAAGSEREGIGGFVGGVVQEAVGRAIGFRARFPIGEVEAIRWEDGRMRVVFSDPERSLENVRLDERPVEEAFTEADVRELAAAFRRLKEEQAGH